MAAHTNGVGQKCSKGCLAAHHIGRQLTPMGLARNAVRVFGGTSHWQLTPMGLARNAVRVFGGTSHWQVIPTMLAKTEYAHRM